MHSVDYFATNTESLWLVRALIDEGFKIIVEPELAETPTATTFATFTVTLVSILERAPVFFYI